MYKNIIWDFDGTLFDTYFGMTEAFMLALDENDIAIELSFDELYNRLKVSMGHTLASFDLDQSFFEEVKKREKRVNIDKFGPFEDSKKICQTIIDQGGKNYIITHRGSSTYDLLKYFDFKQYFEDIITAEDDFNRKPDTEMFEALLKRNTINIEKTLVVGDRELDIIPAKKLGFDSCLITSNITIETKADYVYSSLKDVYQLIK